MINRVKKWYYKKVSKPSAATIEGWQDWKELVSNNHPVLYFMFETLPRHLRRIPKSIKDTKYHLKQKYTRKGYHLLELDVKRFKQPYNQSRLGKYSWMDADTQLELFSFQILVNYIEKEENYHEVLKYYETGDVKWELMEAMDLYHWFINEYCDDTEYLLEKWELYSRYPDYKKI